MGYNTVCPAQVIEAHRAFIARRGALPPSEECRTPTSDEWDEFLAHLEKRKASIGTCARAFGTPCIHAHACVRCSLLRPDPDQRERVVSIRDNLIARIAEAEREGWLGEVEGLRVSLAGAEAHLLDRRLPAARGANAGGLHLVDGRPVCTAGRPDCPPSVPGAVGVYVPDGVEQAQPSVLAGG
ncbi:hypothetical protein [Kitasatospora azatica]|uniref:hypothetical protein n=1 Tax=Kitasatospora azatica TaxID=58347 RepID=UPI001E3460D2|nr:hypothetical protein [Kitasatospora azatica]